jgi:hypothetical protein
MPVSTLFTGENKGMESEPALAMTVARRCRWVNIKGDWYNLPIPTGESHISPPKR